jgi:outer membrane lipoprotein LolB
MATLAFAVAGCAGVAIVGRDQPTRLPELREQFDISGRLSVSRERDGFTGGFRWIAEPEADSIELATPTGQTVATLASAGTQVRLKAADGRTDEAATWEALTERFLGWPLPVSGLRYWIQGIPHPTSAFTRSADDLGRVGSMRQDGWDITYRYGDGGDVSPSGLRMTRQGLDVRVAVDRRG